MPKAPVSSATVLTAQDLRSGDVVYWQGERWVTALTDALVSDDAAAMQMLATAANAGTDVVDAFVFELINDDGVPRPMNYREAQRLTGPSIAFGPMEPA